VLGCHGGLGRARDEKTARSLLHLFAKFAETAQMLDLAAFFAGKGIVKGGILDQAENTGFPVKHEKPNAAPPKTYKARLVDAHKRHVGLPR